MLYSMNIEMKMLMWMKEVKLDTTRLCRYGGSERRWCSLFNMAAFKRVVDLLSVHFHLDLTTSITHVDSSTALS
jgi:hypothetical protein